MYGIFLKYPYQKSVGIFCLRFESAVVAINVYDLIWGCKDQPKVRGDCRAPQRRFACHLPTETSIQTEMTTIEPPGGCWDKRTWPSDRWLMEEATKARQTAKQRVNKIVKNITVKK